MQNTGVPQAPSVVAAGTASLSVTRLALTSFRSYAAAELQTSGRPVVLAGPNGAGKTNLLDALSLLAPGRGLRGVKMSEHIRHAPQTIATNALWAVAATVARNGESYEVGTGLTLGPQGGERRQVHLNGAPATGSGDLSELVQMVWLTPAMDRLFIEGASGRRRFLDRLTLGFMPAHGKNASRYETAMRERARLLKFGPRDRTWLEGLEGEMVEYGISVALARRETVERLNSQLAERADIGAFPAADLSLIGEMDALIATSGSDAANDLREMLEKNRIRDAESGRTSIGPHLTDLHVRHTQKRADAKECSTGEQKALLISIILADAWALSQHRDSVAPILLLDEIAAHLDSTRRAALFEEILSLRAQAWMTGTEMDFFTDLRNEADLFEVVDSTPRPLLTGDS